MCVVGAEREGPPSLLTSISAPGKTHNWLHSPQPHPASVTFLPFLSPHWVAPANQLPHLPPHQRGDLGQAPVGQPAIANEAPAHPRSEAARNHGGVLRAVHPAGAHCHLQGRGGGGRTALPALPPPTPPHTQRGGAHAEGPLPSSLCSACCELTLPLPTPGSLHTHSRKEPLSSLQSEPLQPQGQPPQELNIDRQSPTPTPEMRQVRDQPYMVGWLVTLSFPSHWDLHLCGQVASDGESGISTDHQSQ